MNNWNSSDIPTQSGRSAVVTGTGGLGFQDALALARAGANVIIAGRDKTKGATAVARIREAIPTAQVSFELLDLANLASIKTFSTRLLNSLDSLDLLINNAAVMAPPHRLVTTDGFELQLGTNHLGHFALTAQLLSLLRKGHRPRVVSVSSIAARGGAINFADLHAEHSYKPMVAYSQSKLACLMFALQLQRLSKAQGFGIESIASHPGVSRTDLIPNGAGAQSAAGLARRFLWFLFQPVEQGALPTLFAATSPDARGGRYYGPDKLNETRGFPTLADIPPRALDVEMAERLWHLSERLTGTEFKS